MVAKNKEGITQLWWLSNDIFSKASQESEKHRVSLTVISSLEEERTVGGLEE